MRRACARRRHESSRKFANRLFGIANSAIFRGAGAWLSTCWVMKAIIALALVAGCGAPKPDPATGAGAGAAADTGPVTPEMLAQRPVCDLVLCTLAEHQGACCYRLEHPTWAAFDDKMKTVADQANRCAAVSQYDGYFPVAVT